MSKIQQQLTGKIFTLPQLLQRVKDWRSAKERLVFTNGCFDLLHAGHLAYLTEAAGMGTKLIIGLNSDSSVQALKGPQRPVNNEATRTQLLAAMFFVDAVVIFEEDTPQQLIRTVMPDVLVKGGDYEVSGIAGAADVIANGGRVEVLSFLPGYSSTSVIEKIKNS